MGTVLMLLAIYSLTIKKTINLFSECKATEAKINLAKDAPQRAEQLENELHRIENKIGKQNSAAESKEQQLLEIISHYCQNNHTILREFPKTMSSDQGDLTIETNLFVLEGGFQSLIKLVYLLEQKSTYGKVASVKYQIKKDFKTKEEVLTATVYIQNIKKQQHEK